MQAPLIFQHSLHFTSHLLNPYPTTSKLFFSGTAGTPRRRHVACTTATTPISPSLPDSAITAVEDYQRLFSSQPTESVDPLPLVAIKGSLPADFPLGTYYLNGPGMISDDHGSILNPLDGHGYIRAFRFIGGSAVMYSARYVETVSVKEEREAKTGEWRFRHPGLFSLLKSRVRAPGLKLLKNVANTTVLRWGGRLFCLWEGGHPYELDPASLATIGPTDIIKAGEGRRSGGGGVLNFAARIPKPSVYRLLGIPPKRTLSHYKIDAQRNRLIMLSCNIEDMFLPRTNFTFYEFDSSFQLMQKREFLIPDQLLIHDWAFTDSYYILMGNRTKLNVSGIFPAMTGLAPMISTVSLNPNQPTTPIYLLPRFDNDTIQRDWIIPVEAPSQLWTTHVGNAYEEKDDNGKTRIQIQASVCSYQWFNQEKTFGYDWKHSKLDPSIMNEDKQELPHLIKILIELDARGSCHFCSIADSSIHWKKTADFPVINPANSGKSNRFMYANSTSGSNKFLPHFPFDTVVKFDSYNDTVKTWCTESRRFVGEPMFISKGTKHEEDGYIIVIEYAICRQKCYLVVLDAKRIGDDDAIVVKLEVPEHLSFPFGFHGFWDGQ